MKQELTREKIEKARSHRIALAVKSAAAVAPMYMGCVEFVIEKSALSDIRK